MNEKSEIKSKRFEMLMPVDLIQMIEDWRRAQPEIPSRAAAIAILCKRQIASELSQADAK